MKSFFAGAVVGIMTLLFSWTGQGAEAAKKIYQVRGVVKELRLEKKQVVVDHEDIPDYMDAMTMPFDVRELREVEALKPGDKVVFRFHVTKEEAWIDQVVREGSIEVPKVPANASGAPARLEPLKVGDSMPDFALTDEQGRTLEASAFRGQAVAITFIFTRCPYPNYCPLIANHFVTVQKAMTADTMAPANWQLLSVTIDPDHDRPEVLRAYGTRLQADPNRWRFATGTLKDITTLALRCGIGFWEDKGTIAHDLRTIVFNADGRVRRIFPESNWKAAELVGELRGAALVK